MEPLSAGRNFVALKTLCDRLAIEPNDENAIFLGNHIQQNATEHDIQYHLEYILLPLYVHLHNENLSKEIRQQLVHLLRIVISKARITTLNCFLNLYMALLLQIYDVNQANMLIVAHEELKDCTIRCLNDLMKRSCADVIESLYVVENALKLSQGVFICLSLAKTEKMFSVRFSAIETLMSLANVHDGADFNDTPLRAQIADTLMLFLPGIASGLCQVALDNELQNYKITLMSVVAYGRILSLIMEDNLQDEDLTIESLQIIEKVDKPADPFGMPLRIEGAKGMKRFIETARRSREWFDATSIKLNASIRSLTKLVKHDNYNVRMELISAVELLLSKCSSRNMTRNSTALVEILISLSEDEEEVVKDTARKTLDYVINEKLSRNDRSRPFVQVLEEDFYRLLTKLPRLIRRSDDEIQLLYLNQVAGYIRLLGKAILPRVMESSSHLKRLVLALVYVAELDCSRVSVLEDVQIKDIEDLQIYNLNIFKSFKFIRETLTEDKLMSVCKLLGEVGDVALLTDCIFDLMSEMPQYRKELTLLLNWIVAVPVEDTSMLTLHKQIIDYYTEPENWYSPIQVEEDVTLRDAQSNVVQSCLLTEGLGMIALNLGTEYEKYLLKTLYLVIERAGSGNSLLSEAGLKCLENIAHSQNFSKVTELLHENVDYISYHMTMKMRRFERNPGVLDVFSVVMKYSTMELLPCPKEVVQVALSQLSVNPPQRNTYALLKILYVFVLCIKKMKAETAESQEEKTNDTSTAEIVIQNVFDYYKAKKDSERLDDETVTTPDDIETEIKDGTAAQFSTSDNQEDKEVTPPPPPPYIKMTESVMKCCLNFLPSKEVRISLLSMQIMEEGLGVLSNWSEQLLPLVHEIWHPLVDRFHDSNIQVLNRAWQLLYTLAHVSQDFIRARALQQVLPQLSQFLTKSAKESYKKDSKNAYRFTQIFKLQALILSQASTVARNLKLHERQLWQILEITQPYLSVYQQPTLQEYCVKLFKDVAEFQADIVWVKCLGIWSCHVAPISINSTLTLANLKETAARTTGGKKDYQINIESILTFVEEMSARYL